MKIVAPAGNMERFYSAISATADEIYLVLKGFGERAKKFLGKTMLGHEEFYKYLEDNSLIETLK